MLERLRAHIDGLDLPDEPLAQIASARFGSSDTVLELVIWDDDERERLSRWRVTAKAVREHCLVESFGELDCVEGDHVLTRQYTDPRRTLHFRGAPQRPLETVGRLHALHRELCECWIPFDRYFNHGLELGELLAGGYGELAQGPRFLIERYAGELEGSGAQPQILTDEQKSRSPAPVIPLAALMIGCSYVVAEDFQEERLAGEA